MEKKKRLQKFIAEAGITSRRKAEEMILAGLVKVNNLVVTQLGHQVSNEDSVEVMGEMINGEQKIAFLFYKPLRVMSTVSDEQNRETVVDFFKNFSVRLYPVGRLDYLTTGAIVMTNDGELAHLMMHPSSHLPKTYIVTIDKKLANVDQEKLTKGILLEDGPTAPSTVSIIGDKVISLTIIEGRNRQVRRMFKTLGYQVKKLHRQSIGFLDVSKMACGEYRQLNKEEISKIKTMCLAQQNINQIPEYKKKK